MLKEIGRVVAVEQQAVWVETIPSSLCGKCAAKAGCAQGVLARSSGHRGLVRARETAALKASACAVDDQVEIAIPESAVLSGSVLVYLAPLLSGIAGVLLVQGMAEWITVLGFIVGLGIGFAFVRVAPRWLGREAHFEPQLTAVVAAAPAVIAHSA